MPPTAPELCGKLKPLTTAADRAPSLQAAGARDLRRAHPRWCRTPESFDTLIRDRAGRSSSPEGPSASTTPRTPGASSRRTSARPASGTKVAAGRELRQQGVDPLRISASRLSTLQGRDSTGQQRIPTTRRSARASSSPRSALRTAPARPARALAVLAGYPRRGPPPHRPDSRRRSRAAAPGRHPGRVESVAHCLGILQDLVRGHHVTSEG